jgi:DNA-binding SARP family transcriptional activator
MLRLTVLGGVSLLGAGVGIDLANRGWQRAALLALLAGAGPRGLAREQLLALLWPDVDEERGRHSLNEILSRLRRDSGRSALFTGTLRLALNPAEVTVDAWELIDAVSARHVERALQLYRGPFGDGVRTTGLNELEQRLTMLRAEHERAFIEIGEFAARQATERRDYATAARWWQRLADLDPLSERVACELVGAYAAIPDMASASRALRVHETLVRQELGVPAGSHIREWGARLARMPADAVARAVTPSARPTPTHIDPMTAQVERIRTQLSPRYAVTQLVESGSIFMRLRAVVPAEGARSVDVNVLQPRAAAFVDEAAFVRAMEPVIPVTAPQLLPYLEVGTRAGVVYLVTSPMPELTLRAMLRREGTLAVEVALRLSQCIARALASAHECGVFHGDFRPRHVGLLPGDAAVVGGFGVVPALLAQGTQGDDTAVLSYGSPRYLSPEQRFGGSAPDARSDVYAFGCTLHHMFAGEPPRSSAPVDPAHLTMELLRRRPSTPKGLTEIIASCVALHPADRLANGRELVDAVGAVRG